MGLRDVFHTDLTLLHAPSVYDFRRETILRGPVADAIPSTDQFEMYPAGMTSIASYLGKNHYNVRMVNLAYRMLKDPSYDVERRLARLDSTVFGVDLHGLPHANGALGVAELTKRLHPESMILLGGLSSSYYHEELIRYPFVDYVLRGDSTEEPCRQLLSALRDGRPLDSVENLTWKRPGGEVAVNPLTFIPSDLDYVDIPDYRYAVKSVFKYHSLADLVPYLRWLGHPTGMLLNSRGCTLNCSTCGGSRSAYRDVCGRPSPAFRSPEKLVSDVRSFHAFSRGPIVMVHDPRMGGLDRAKRFFSLLKKEKVSNELVFEAFFPAGDDYFTMVQESVPKWSLEITLESADERLRKLGSLKFPVPNERVEATIASALGHGCRRLDLFFMVGIPHQSREDVLATVPYCEHLVDRFNADPRLQFFMAPMGPFLDPGSAAFEDPELGYTRFYKTVEEHRRALLQPAWNLILSYETDAITRDEILSVSYEVTSALNELKFRRGLVDRATYEEVRSHQVAAREAMEDVRRVMRLPERERRDALARINEEVRAANFDSLFSKTELDWPGGEGPRFGAMLLRTLASGLAQEAVHGLRRLAGSYDTAVYTGRRLEPFSELGGAAGLLAAGPEPGLALAPRSARQRGLLHP